MEDSLKDFLFDEYTEVAEKTAIYPEVYMPDENGEFHVVPGVYTVLGLASEAGEVAGKLKKIIRDANGVYSSEMRKALIDECGDVIWYLDRTLNSEGMEMRDE